MAWFGGTAARSSVLVSLSLSAGAGVSSGPRAGRFDLREALLASLAATTLVSLIHLTPPTLFEGVDWQQLHLPAREYLAAALRAGRLPLWNPHVSLGRPFLADIETAVFYPPNLAYVVLEPTLAYALLAATHATLAVMGVLLLGRRLRLAPWAGWLCAALFVSGEALVARLQSGQTHYAHAITYLPLALLLAVRLVDGVSWGRVLALAVTLALQLLCGHPQIAWLTWLGLGAFVLGRTDLGPGDLRQGVRGLLALAVALAAALALAAPTLLPFLELAGQGNRASHSAELSGREGMSAFYWSSLAVPDGGVRAFYWEFNVYAGVCVLVGGIAGLLATWRERETRGLVAMALVGALLASGAHTPAFSLFYALLPGTSLFRLHARAALLVVLALVLGLGLLLSRRPRPSAAGMALALGVASAVLLTVAYRSFAPGSVSPLPALPRLAWIAAALAVLAGALAARGGRVSGIAAAAVAFVALVDVGSALPSAKRAWNMEVRRQGERPLHEALLRLGLYDRRGIPPRVAVPPELVRENAGVVYGWSHIAGYQAVSLARVWGFVHGSLGIAPPRESTFPSPQIYERGPFPYDSMSLVAGVDPSTWQLVGRRDADPRAYVATGVRRVGHWREAVALMRAGHDFHDVALMEAPLAAGLVERRGTGTRASAHILSFAPEEIAVRIESEVAGVLVLAEPWYPGWQATVDGAPGGCLPANGWMRAVPVPAGRHQVRLRFRSRWLGAGLLLAGATLTGLSALAWRERRGGATLASAAS
jgi:hypothetical protein